ncbi:DUF397 domain-containing protein [Nocardiopsis lucentensis]|uniref:DUF397 domain-containing protein n=1 Tax=Nocardiopsis lucentensis TaxID=53441 RepID=UPI00036B33E0|nr:DUF397 domain-containing protein [Nocardiopsis lucentensis]
MTENWHKSSYSGGSGDCVEVCEAPDVVKVRDTQNRSLGYLSFPGDQWAALLHGLRDERA